MSANAAGAGMTQAELLDVFALTGELLQHPERDPIMIELCNVAGRMAFELLHAEQPVASTTVVSEPTAQSVSTHDADVPQVDNTSTSPTASASTSAAQPKRKRDWAAIKRRQRAKQRAAQMVEPEARP
jgi:hypothetical protein